MTRYIYKMICYSSNLSSFPTTSAPTQKEVRVMKNLTKENYPRAAEFLHKSAKFVLSTAPVMTVRTAKEFVRLTFILLVCMTAILLVWKSTFPSAFSATKSPLEMQKETLKTVLQSHSRSVSQYSESAILLATERVLSNNFECSESALLRLRLMSVNQKAELIDHELLRCVQVQNIDKFVGNDFAMSMMTKSGPSVFVSLPGIKMKPGHTFGQSFNGFYVSTQELKPQLLACGSIIDDLDALMAQLEHADSPGKLWFVQERYNAWRSRVENSRRDKLCRVEY